MVCTEERSICTSINTEWDYTRSGREPPNTSPCTPINPPPSVRMPIYGVPLSVITTSAYKYLFTLWGGYIPQPHPPPCVCHPPPCVSAPLLVHIRSLCLYVTIQKMSARTRKRNPSLPPLTSLKAILVAVVYMF